ncbi:MAG TPA: tail fiber domain-containing protein [Cyclobacteriaceae bacterium]|nr:tail fiber domain-containing protein [Cyclobacteriaceae bacterium]
MKWRDVVLACSFIAPAIFANAQNSVGIGVSNPNKHAVLELISPGNNQGLLIPKLTTAQRTASSFTGGLSAKENGLMVFDSDQKKFYYWDSSAWKEIGTGGGTFQSGEGITISGTTISTIPQGLEIDGSTLVITGNPSAVPINLSDLNIPQDLNLTGSTLKITNNPSATAIDLSTVNVPQDLELTGSTLKITNNPSATPINLGSLGSNTDDQTLTYDGATGGLTISRISGGPQTVTIPTSTPPSGAAAGDLTGNYPNPTVANNAITSAKILDGSVSSGDITDLTIVNGDISATAGIVVTKLAAGTAGQVLTTVGTTPTWTTAPTASGAAGGDLTGTYPNPDIAANAVTTAEILDGSVSSGDITDLTIVNGDISATAGIVVTKLAAGTAGQVLTTVGTTPTWTTAPTASGAAGGDLTGTYPNPDIAANAVTTAEILDGTVSSGDITDLTIVNGDISATAGIVVTKLAAGTAGQVLTTVGTTPTWTTAPTASGAAGGDLTGTYPNPDIAANAVTTAEILDGTVSSADITDNSVSTTDILDNTVSTTDITDNTITNSDIAAGAGIVVSKIAPSGTPGQVLTTVGATTQWANAPAPSGAAGGDLTGTYPNPDIATGAVTTAEIANLTIADADISTTAAVAVSKLAAGSNGQILQTSGTTVVWGAPGASVLISAPGTANLFAGSPMAGLGATGTRTDNVFYGPNAGSTATTGAWNVAMGSQAGQNMTQGTLNTIIGWQAGLGNATSSYNGNTFLGAEAGRAVTGGPNTFVGEKAGRVVTTGTENVFMGNSAGLAVTTGGRNTIIGYQANVVGSNTQNSIAIGYQTVVDDNNKIRLGNSSIGVIEGNVGFTAASDRRLKENIRPIDTGLDLIMKLKPVQYTMKNLSDKRTNWGFIAQDIQAIVGETNAVLTIAGNKEKTLGLRYSDFVAPLVKAVQEQQDQITDLNAKLSESEKKVEMLMAEIELIKKAVGLKASNK